MVRADARTPPAPVSAGPPRGARAACSRQTKNEQRPFRFQDPARIFEKSACRIRAACAAFSHRICNLRSRFFFDSGLELKQRSSKSFSVPKRKEPEEDNMTDLARSFDENV